LRILKPSTAERRTVFNETILQYILKEESYA